jgi:dethiobiotin synthetase
MLAPLIVVTGTGTGIGKTHIACAVLRRVGDHQLVFGYKPVESGVSETCTSDAERLASVSTFHVKHPPGLQLSAAVSPHLAARLEGKVLDWSKVVEFTRDLRSQGVAVLLELPGGLFTPLSDELRSVDGLALLHPSATLLVAPDRLGVLHDVGAAITGAKHVGVAIAAIGLVTPETSDPSTGRNAQELSLFVDIPILGPWSRASVEDLQRSEATIAVMSCWLGVDIPQAASIHLK